MSSIKSMLSVAVNEKDVENAWRGYLTNKYKNAVISSPYKCDGYLVDGQGQLRILCEFKYNPNLKNFQENLPVIGQAIYYLRKFIDNGSELPNVIFIADINECFVIPMDIVLKYAKGNYDWTIAPCDAGKNLQLMADLSKDEIISPFVFDIDDNFNWLSVHSFIIRTVRQVNADIAICSDTLPTAFEYWRKNVMKHDLPDNKHIEIFFKVLTSPSECYKHPKKENILVVGDSEYKINKKGYNGFFSVYKETHNPVEVRNLTANKDRLLVEINRRRTGAFFTPSDWVNEAHKMLTENLGPNWRDEYVVWDCSCGTANLTRDYAFKELYLSTLEDTDINIIREAGYNNGATIFQFDFLNDSLDKLPEGLLKALESGKKIVFLNNPPYATASNNTFVDGKENKIEVASDTMINKMMKMNNIGASSQQLYAQFMYRIMKIVSDYNLTKVSMATFSMPLFMQGESFSGFREKMNMKFIDGMMFQASHFSDVSDSWSIVFSIFMI